MDSAGGCVVCPGGVAVVCCQRWPTLMHTSCHAAVHHRLVENFQRGAEDGESVDGRKRSQTTGGDVVGKPFFVFFDQKSDLSVFITILSAP